MKKTIHKILGKVFSGSRRQFRAQAEFADRLSTGMLTCAVVLGIVLENKTPDTWFFITLLVMTSIGMFIYSIRNYRKSGDCS